MAKMIFDDEGLLEEPCLSCDKAYIEDIWNEWCCDERECKHIVGSFVEHVIQNRKRGKMIVEFHHGALSDSYEEQANAQGFTFGDMAEWVEKVGYGLVCAHIHGCITDSEYDKIFRRFQTKILLKNLKSLEKGEDNEKI